MATPPAGRGFPAGAWGMPQGSESDDSEADEPSVFQRRTPVPVTRPAAPASPAAAIQQLSIRSAEDGPGHASTSQAADANDVESHLVSLTQTLLDAIAAGDYSTYRTLCDPSLSAFEPEARGGLVQGLEFHRCAESLASMALKYVRALAESDRHAAPSRFYFNLPRRAGGPTPNQTMVAPTTRLIGDSAAVVTYTRLSQSFNAETQAPATAVFEETRVWEKKERGWVNVHFHRSVPSS